MLDSDISSAQAQRLLSVGGPGPDRGPDLGDLAGPNGWTRRQFLQAVGMGVGVGAAAGTLGPAFADVFGFDPVAAFAATPIAATDGVLVNIVLYGGNDGLNTVVPYTDGLYYDGRRDGVTIPQASVLALDSAWGLNPNLPYVKYLWDIGQVALVHGVGYPRPDLSHFTSMAIWMHGNVAGGTPSSGWIGRWHDQVAADRAEMSVATIGWSVPLHLQGFNRRALGIPYSGDLFGSYTGDHDLRLYNGVRSFAAASAGRGPWHDAYAGVLRTQVDVAADVAPIFVTETVGSEFERKMIVAARMINANLGFRIVDVGLGEFDHHDNLPDKHPALLAELDAGLRAFFDTLLPQWRPNVTLMTMSEFGRTVYSNDSRGTDHGTANVHFVIGEHVKGGHYGSSPSLNLPDRWDRLPHTVDFRSLYGSVLDGWLGVGSASVLNGGFENLRLFRAPPGSPPGTGGGGGGGVLPPAPVSAPAGFVPMAPVRIMDTRDGSGGVKFGALAPGEMVKVPVRGVQRVPADAVAIVANVTAVDATQPGYFTVFPGNTAKPGTSNLNTRPGRPVPNLVVMGIGGDGCVDVFNAHGEAHCLVDVFGYFAAGGAGDRFTPLPPKRLFDTRTGQGVRPGKIAHQSPVDVQVIGMAGVPSGATAVVINLAVVEPESPGWMRVRPTGEPVVSDTSNVNFFAGDVVPNLTMCKLGTNGQISIDGVGNGAHVLGDVFGYFGASGSLLRTIAPDRLLDTRHGTGAPQTPIGGATTARLVVGGRGTIPGSATAVVLNVTATNVAAPSFVTVWPDGQPMPDTSNLNVFAGQTVANLVVVRLGNDGALQLANPIASCDLIADALGYFVD